MRQPDSGFGRLIAAWAPRLRSSRSSGSFEPTQPADTVPTAPESSSANGWPTTSPHSGFDSSLPAAAGRFSVLIATARATHQHIPHIGTVAGAGASLAMRLAPVSGYRVDTVSVASASELERLLVAQQPRLLLIDIELADAFDREALRRVRRSVPATDWLLLWHTANSRGFERAIACEARGCIDWQASTEQFVSAFRTVIGGELWFPRQAMQSLYFSLLEAAHGAAGSPPPTAADAAALVSRPELTEREAEVLALMRQGLTNQQIADRLDISINTVKKHVAHAFEKRGLSHRRQVIG